MKKLILSLVLMVSILFSCQTKESKVQVTEKPKTDTTIHAPKIVFLVYGRNINFDEMGVDSVIKALRVDSILMVKPISPELRLNSQVIKVYRADDITCPYLKKRFKEFEPGYLLFEYSDKLLVKCNNGVMKLYHYHLHEGKVINNEK